MNLGGFGAGQGIRIKRIPVAKQENEDPILALLRQDTEEKEEEESKGQSSMTVNESVKEDS
jgi:exopolysaccharide biosynthesis predicted pyruvyltransferase EpsI